MCQAEDIVEPPCIDLWPEELWERLGDMGAGIALSALVAERRNAAIHERIAASNEAAEQAMKVKGRSRGRRKN